jgi:hypothetical protein
MLEFIKGRELQCPELLPGTLHFSRNILFLDISTPRAGKQNAASCLNKAGKKIRCSQYAVSLLGLVWLDVCPVLQHATSEASIGRHQTQMLHKAHFVPPPKCGPTSCSAWCLADPNDTLGALSTTHRLPNQLCLRTPSESCLRRGKRFLIRVGQPIRDGKLLEILYSPLRL